jgi:hypothetical protein
MLLAMHRRPGFRVCKETQMNRIERLMWEKAQLDAIAPLKRESRWATGAKALAVTILMVVIALLATRVPVSPADESMLGATVAASTGARTAGTAGPAPARDATDGTARAIGNDNPPAATY